MKKIILPVALIFLISNAEAATRTRGYIKNNGTYVQPHIRTSPNSTRIDNYSTKGNINSHTGNKGYKKIYK